MTPYKIKNINQLDNKILDNSIVKNKIKDFNKQLSDNGSILVRPSELNH